jgi:hypothetical protein
MGWLKWATENWRLLIGAAVCIAIFGTGYNIGVNSEQQKQAKKDAVAAADAMSAMTTHAKMILDLEVQHDKDEKYIRDYKRTHPDGGLYLPPTPCAGPANSGGNVQAAPRKESLSVRTQQAINSYTKGVDALMLEADLVVNDCRVERDYLLKLAPAKP